MGRREEPIPQCFNVDPSQIEWGLNQRWEHDLQREDRETSYNASDLLSPGKSYLISSCYAPTLPSAFHFAASLPQIHQREPSFYHLQRFKLSFRLWTYWIFPEQWQSQNTKCLDAEVCRFLCALPWSSFSPFTFSAPPKLNSRGETILIRRKQRGTLINNRTTFIYNPEYCIYVLSVRFHNAVSWSWFCNSGKFGSMYTLKQRYKGWACTSMVVGFSHMHKVPGSCSLKNHTYTQKQNPGVLTMLPTKLVSNG